MTEQSARAEALEIVSFTAITDKDWLVDMLTCKLMTWYHKGAIDAMDITIAKIGPRGETNVVRTLGEEGRILP